MPNQPPLNPDALENAADVIWMNTRNESGVCDADRRTDDYATIEAITSVAIKEYLAVAQPEVNSAVEAFINQRPEYITALKNTRGTDDQADYHRWQGHAESRRQLAQALGWTVPHNPGETTRQEAPSE